MPEQKKTVLVLGATGRQGGATARHLLDKDWQVRAMTRDPQQPAAQALSQAGAEIVRGDFDDRASLDAALQGVYGVFSVQAYGGSTAYGEILQGKAIVDAAKAAGVQHFVYTSVQSAEDLARVGGDGNKWEIEQYVRQSGLPYTILRPCLFMDDLFDGRYGVPDGTFSIAFLPETTVGLIASEDIGAFAALAFEHPETYLGKTLEIAGDAPTPPQIAQSISRAMGRTIPYVQMPVETLRAQNEIVARAFDFLNEVGYTADIAAQRGQYPDLMTLDAWLAHHPVHA